MLADRDCVGRFRLVHIANRGFAAVESRGRTNIWGVGRRRRLLTLQGMELYIAGGKAQGQYLLKSPNIS